MLYFYDKNKTFLNYNSSLSNGTFTAPDKAYYVNFRCFTVDFTSNYTKLKVQLEQGSFATDYEPYTGGEPSPNPDYPQKSNHFKLMVHAQMLLRHIFVVM